MRKKGTPRIPGSEAAELVVAFIWRIRLFKFFDDKVLREDKGVAWKELQARRSFVLNETGRADSPSPESPVTERDPVQKFFERSNGGR